MTRNQELVAAYPTEGDLCAAFMVEARKQAGWDVYPETGGFDILLVEKATGRQIGVEAKLQLNVKVVEQILPHASEWGIEHGPDHRVVLVRNVTEASAGLEKALEWFGVPVLQPYAYHRDQFGLERLLHEDSRAGASPEWEWAPGKYGHSSTAMRDWNPKTRITLPEYMPDVPAGVPGPRQLSPWKCAALRVLARLRLQGSITAKQIKEEGCSPTIWTTRWLAKSETRGLWVAGPVLPTFDTDHPGPYAVALAAMTAQITKEKEAGNEQ